MHMKPTTSDWSWPCAGSSQNAEHNASAIGILENFVNKPEILRHEFIIIKLERFSFAGQVIEYALLLRFLNALFNDLVQKSHNQIVTRDASSERV